MQDHFEKIAMDKALEVGGKKAFELLENSIQRFNESLRYSETGGKEIRSEIAGYRKGLLELYRLQLLSGSQPETKITGVAAAQPNANQDAKSTGHTLDLSLVTQVFKKEVAEVMEQLADSYIERDEATSLIILAAETFADKVEKIKTEMPNKSPLPRGEGEKLT